MGAKDWDDWYCLGMSCCKISCRNSKEQENWAFILEGEIPYGVLIQVRREEIKRSGHFEKVEGHVINGLKFSMG